MPGIADKFTQSAQGRLPWPGMTSVRCELLRLARKRNLSNRPRQNNPTGKSPKTLSSPLSKNIPLNPSGKSVI
jgi:hypothetical protein